MARLLRRLVVEQDDVALRPALAVLLEAPFLPHLVEFRLGEQASDGSAEALIRQLVS